MENLRKKIIFSADSKDYIACRGRAQFRKCGQGIRICGQQTVYRFSRWA